MPVLVRVLVSARFRNVAGWRGILLGAAPIVNGGTMAPGVRGPLPYDEGHGTMGVAATTTRGNADVVRRRLGPIGLGVRRPGAGVMPTVRVGAHASSKPALLAIRLSFDGTYELFPLILSWSCKFCVQASEFLIRTNFDAQSCI